MNKFLLTFKDKTIDDLKEFAKKAEDANGGVIISSGKNYFDGSSFMSLIAIKNCDNVFVFYHEDEKDFEKFLDENYFKPYCSKIDNYMENI
jgi:hypothetical protein